MNWENKLFKEQVIWQYPGYGPHAVFTPSDKHSNSYFNSDHLVNQPSLLEDACSYLYKTAMDKTSSNPDWLITYAPYGLQIGSCLSRLFGSRFGFTASNNAKEINFNLHHSEKVLLYADDLHTGARMQNLIDIVAAKQVEIISPIIFVANYSGRSKFHDREIVSLINLEIDVWNPDECPLCNLGSPRLNSKKALAGSMQRFSCNIS
jgi:orotate phosphoribosyltransferase